VLGLFHAVLVFRLLFHAASALPLDCAVDAASALPRSDRVVQPWSFAAVSAMSRPWYRAPARSFSLGWNQTMLSWEPERIIFAHGPWHDANGTTELRNAFRWLLK
jgi:hypothetical protein